MLGPHARVLHVVSFLDHYSSLFLCHGEKATAGIGAMDALSGVLQ